MGNIASTEERAPHTNGVHSRAMSRRGHRVAGRYELSREVARGGMGVVFEARNVFSGRMVALKLVTPESPQAPLARKRLLQEARALGAVRHPNVVEIYDAGECPSEGPYIAMEMLEGRTLDGILAARRTLGIPEAMEVAKRIGRALAFAHQQGICHRDVKPSNIFIARSPAGDEAIKLIDFGIAGVIGSPPDDQSSRITRAGDMLGTLDYVSPEQLGHADIVEPRSDQYALATVLFECLTGSVPPISDRLAGPRHMVDLRKIVENIPEHVAAAINRAMMPQADARFPSMEAFMTALLGDGRVSHGAMLLRAMPSKRAVPPDSLPTAPPPDAQPAAATRRRYRRAPYVSPCRVVREDGSNIDARTEDISEGGILVVLPQGFGTPAPRPDLTAALAAQGALEKVKIRFALPTTGNIATVAGVVRWLRDGRGRVALGIEFEGLLDEARTAIAMYVKHLGEGGGD